MKTLYRVRFYYPLQRYNIRKPAVRRTLRNLSAALQLGFGVDRTRRRPDGFVFQKGAQWFSITHALALYLLEKESEIREFFSDTYCPDEMFVQTEIVNSPFRDTLPEHAFENDYASCLRYIDWQRGNPYTFTDGDLDELIALLPRLLTAKAEAGLSGAQLLLQTVPAGAYSHLIYVSGEQPGDLNLETLGHLTALVCGTDFNEADYQTQLSELTI